MVIAVGVVLPAVWSRRRSRRCAASVVLDRVLTSLEVILTRRGWSVE